MTKDIIGDGVIVFYRLYFCIFMAFAGLVFLMLCYLSFELGSQRDVLVDEVVVLRSENAELLLLSKGTLLGAESVVDVAEGLQKALTDCSSVQGEMVSASCLYPQLAFYVEDSRAIRDFVALVEVVDG